MSLASAPPSDNGSLAATSACAQKLCLVATLYTIAVTVDGGDGYHKTDQSGCLKVATGVAVCGVQQTV